VRVPRVVESNDTTFVKDLNTSHLVTHLSLLGSSNPCPFALEDTMRTEVTLSQV